MQSSLETDTHKSEGHRQWLSSKQCYQAHLRATETVSQAASTEFNTGKTYLIYVQDEIKTFLQMQRVMPKD